MIKARHSRIISLLAFHSLVFSYVLIFWLLRTTWVEIIRRISSKRGDGEMREGNLGIYETELRIPKVKKMVK